MSRAGESEQSVTDSRLASLVITHTDNAHNTLTLPSLLSVTTEIRNEGTIVAWSSVNF